MKFKILHEIRGRLRIHILNRYSQQDFDKLFCVLNADRQIKRCKVYPATNDLMIEYFGSKEDAIKLLCQTEPDTSVINIEKLTPEILRAFIKRIDVYEKEIRYSRTCGNTIVIQYTFQLDKN